MAVYVRACARACTRMSALLQRAGLHFDSSWLRALAGICATKRTRPRARFFSRASGCWACPQTTFASSRSALSKICLRVTIP